MPRFLTLAALVVTLSLSGCSIFGGSDDGDCGSGSANDATGSLTATVAGNSFRSVCIQGTVDSGTLSLGGNLGATEGGSQKQINLTVSGAQAGQTYSIGGFSPIIIATYSELDISDPTNTDNLYTAGPGSGSGSITVDAVSASGASGSFEFTGRNNSGAMISVTNGRFDVEF